MGLDLWGGILQLKFVRLNKIKSTLHISKLQFIPNYKMDLDLLDFFFFLKRKPHFTAHLNKTELHICNFGRVNFVS